MNLSYIKLFVLLYLSSISVSATVTNFLGGFTFGTQGTGNGEFNNPHDAVVDSEGNIYVLDSTRIQKFTRNGTFILTWGSEGAGDGEFNTPNGLAVDDQDQIFVADSGNHRIQKFTKDGTFTSEWGTQGSGDGEFESPNGIAIDTEGNIFVADSGNHRIQKFSRNGTYLSQWGTQGSGDGEFESPSGVAVDTQGHIFVADSGNQRIQKVSNNGTFLLLWGVEGSEAGEFQSPSDVDVDLDGHVFVVDQGNHRIQTFTDNGTFVYMWGTQGNVEGELQSPTKLFVNRSGDVLVVDFGNQRIQTFYGPCRIGTGVTLNGLCEPCIPGKVRTEKFITFECTQACPRGYYCVNGEQILCPVGRECYDEGLSAPKPCGKSCVKRITAFGSRGNGDGEFESPTGVAVDSFGNIFVLDAGNFRVQKFSNNGNFLLEWGSHGIEDGQFLLTVKGGISVDVNRNIFVVDGLNRVQKFSENGTFLISWINEGIFSGVRVNFEGAVYVSRFSNPTPGIVIFDDDGESFTEINALDVPNSMYSPNDIVFNSFGDIIVPCESGPLVKFTGSGKFARFVGDIGSGFGNTKDAKGVSITSKDEMCVADTGNSRIQIFSKDDTFFTSLSYLGNGTDRFNSPQGIAVDKEGHIYVADTGNHRIVKIERFQCPPRMGLTLEAECVFCLNGTYPIETPFSTRCTTCPIGQYCANGVATSCPQNHVCAVEGLEKPVLCPYGSFTSVIGNTNVKCDFCPSTERCGQCSVFPGEPLCAEYEASERARLASIVAPSVILPITFSIFFILFGLPYLLKKRVPKSFDSKRYVAFLSHYKTEAGAEARILKDRLQTCLNKRYRGKSLRGLLEVFLDSDDLYDLATLKENVKNSQVLLILLTKSIYTRPWCLVEINTALEYNIPIVPVLLQGKEYNFDQAREFLEHFSASLLEKMNPGSVAVIQKEGISIRTIGAKMGDIIPKLIARSFNANGGQRNIEAEVNDILDAIMVAANGIMTYPAHERTVSIAIPDTSATIAPEIISDKLLMSLEQELSLFFKSKGIEKSPTQVKDLALRARRDSNGVYVGMHELNMALTNRFGSGINVQKGMQNRGKYDDL